MAKPIAGAKELGRFIGVVRNRWEDSGRPRLPLLVFERRILVAQALVAVDDEHVEDLADLVDFD